MNQNYPLRALRVQDNPHIARLVREVMTELGASGPGFSLHDEELLDMASSYQAPRARYFVIEYQGKIMGGAGIAPLKGADSSICELKKMYCYPALRGIGQGGRLMESCLKFARESHYRQVYIETLNSMQAACRLYEKWGFQALPGPLGATGHFGCDRYYQLTL